MTDSTAKSPDLSVFHSHGGAAMAEPALAQSTPSLAIAKYVFFAMVYEIARDRLRVEEEARIRKDKTMFSIEAIMSTDLITVSPTATLAEARNLMRTHRIHHLPVLDNSGALVGLMTLTNVLAATDSVLRDSDSRIHAAEILVGDIMVTDIATIDEHASLRQAALFIEKHQIGCLPIVTGGKLRGIITDTDFVGVAINLLELAEESEPVDVEFA
jgi:CBS domain-containing protein